MRILLLSFYFEPDLSAGSFRAGGLVRELEQMLGANDKIDVLTTQPNRYATYAEPASEKEVRGKIVIRRFKLPAHRSGFMDQSRAFARYAFEVLKATRHAEYDLVFATSSRLFTASLGALIATRKRAALYLDIRDIFVDTLKDVLPPLAARVLLPVFRLLEAWTMRSATHINLVSEGFRDYFLERYPTASLSVISNGIDDVFTEVDFTKPMQTEKKIVLYAGNIGEGQGLARIIPGLAKALVESHEFWIVGDGGRRSELVEAVGALRNVTIMSPVKRTALLELYRRSDILFLHLNDYPAFRRVLPSKLFEYAATSKPIVAGVSGYAALFLEQIPGVAVFPPCDLEQGVAAFAELASEPIERGEFVESYRRGKLARELADSILHIASSEARKA